MPGPVLPDRLRVDSTALCRRRAAISRQQRPASRRISWASKRADQRRSPGLGGGGLAAAIAAGAGVLLLDHPFDSLDAAARDRVCEWLVAARPQRCHCHRLGQQPWRVVRSRRRRAPRRLHRRISASARLDRHSPSPAASGPDARRRFAEKRRRPAPRSSAPIVAATLLSTLSCRVGRANPTVSGISLYDQFRRWILALVPSWTPLA